MVQLHLEEPSAVDEARSTFVELFDSTYANKSLGSSGQLEVMSCDCAQHAGSDDEDMCGANANCINRLTYMECYGEDSGCDAKKCQNRRFQNHDHAKIDVFHAGLKGFGVRASEDIPKGGFIYEYTGEVLDEQRFLKRQQKYEREGVKHFYFMMLQKDEFIDATEKGSLARFCNHSCDPNANIEKWIVGPKIRMGLFAKRAIVKGEEICFDYKVDRYGSKAQPCYCDSENCSGFLGGRTQTGGTLLPPSVVEGLGLDSETALSWHEKSLLHLRKHLESSEGKAPIDLESVLLVRSLKRRESVGKEESDANPVNCKRSSSTRKQRVKPTDLLALLDAPLSSLNDHQVQVQKFLMDQFPCHPLDTDKLPEFMRVLMHTKDTSWLVDLMLKRIIHTPDPKIQRQVMNMHGYEILGTVLSRWKNHDNVVLSAFEVLRQWPKVTKNKISSSQIEGIVSEIKSSNNNSLVCQRADSLLTEWGNLSMGYRIPRKKPPVPSKPDASLSTANGAHHSEPTAASDSSNLVEKPNISSNGGSAIKRNRISLPPGWKTRISSDGRTYYINEKECVTSWKPPRDLRDVEKEAKIRKKELEDERRRLEALQREREKQASEIQRIISEVAIKKSPSVEAPHSQANTTAANESAENPSQSTQKYPHNGIRLIFSSYIPKLVFKFEKELGRERCKRHARDIVHILVKKEAAKNKITENYELTDERKNKLKAFVKQYMEKLSSRHSK